MRLTKFQVWNYRNILDSGEIDVDNVTAFVGQNEAGKSNLFEALYRINPFKKDVNFNFDEDWPVDRFGERASNRDAVVCTATFALEADDVASLMHAAQLPQETPEIPVAVIPSEAVLIMSVNYQNKRTYVLNGLPNLDEARTAAWVNTSAPKFVFIQDYATIETTTELPSLVQRYFANGPQGNWSALNAQDQSIIVVLHLAGVDLQEFVKLGESAQGRTLRTYNKKQASWYLSEQFRKLWTQKRVSFDIEIDGTTLNIFVQDEGMGMPVPLKNRSTGFRWHVAFAWNFTYATRGEYKNCILLLEEPGIHLHLDGQLDLLKVFDDLAAKSQNQILYTTHLSSMIDAAFPERVRIVESRDHHARVIKGVVSNQRRPMAVIEARLGLRGDLSGLLGDRKNLIVEGGTDLLILEKLSGLLKASGRQGLANDIYLWPSETATKAPMFAAFLIGNKWSGGALLDKDHEGITAKKKIEDLFLKEVAKHSGYDFPILLLGDAAGLAKTDAGIEDLFPNDFFREIVNRSYGVAIDDSDLPVDGSTLIANRVERALKQKHGHELEKKRVLRALFSEFNKWNTADDLPGETATNAETLFRKINDALGSTLTSGGPKLPKGRKKTS